MTIPTMRVPGDKSLSHRVLMLSTLAHGTSRIRGLLDARDVRSTAGALVDAGASVPTSDWEQVRIAGPTDLTGPSDGVDCGNSGTTARLLVGMLAGLGLETVVDGDASLRRRPMDRVVYPLQAMGARMDYLNEEGRLPLRIHARASGSLRPLRHRPRVASAQIKSCLLLAGLTSGARVEIVEPGRSRDHTERLLESMGAPIRHGPEGEGARVTLSPRGEPVELRPLDLTVPGDASSAAFLVAAALLAHRPLRLEGVGLNPTRIGWIEVLRRMGAELRTEETAVEAGEPVGSITVRPSGLGPFEIDSRLVPRVLDEIPVLAVLAARAEGTSVLEGAEELRLKESDRLTLLADNLARLGVACEERPDGLRIDGSDARLEGSVTTGGDHRMAMAFGVLRADADARVEVDDPGCVAVSYPEFWNALETLTP
jgi:3-phosphoshikimate 1-carboxyvinyltransferase